MSGAPIDVTDSNATALKLLNARSARGEFLIPTPQANGRYSGSSVSLSREDQFNANADFRVNQNNWLAVKFFFAQTLALSGAANVPGFPVAEEVANRLLSVQDVHTFNSRVINEARFGFNFTRRDVTTQQAIRDADLGMTRSTAGAFPCSPPESLLVRLVARLLIEDTPNVVRSFCSERSSVSPAAMRTLEEMLFEMPLRSRMP